MALKNKYNNYDFCVEKTVPSNILKAYHQIKVCVKNINGEKILYSINNGGNYTLYLNDRFLSFNIDNQTKRVCSFDGELAFLKIKSAPLKLPDEIKNAILVLNTENELISGCGGYIRFNIKKVQYDKANNLLQIGDIDKKETIYRFLGNAFVQLKKDEISGLLFSEIEM